MTRFSNLIVALTLLPIVVPLILITSIVVFVVTRENPIFTQTRLGKDRRTFTLYKLRTMRTDTGNLPSHLVDHRKVTKIGKILRVLKIDETPQLLNVLKDDLHFVGPRPCLPDQHDVIEARLTHDLFSVHPGITGPSQLMKVDMSKPILQAEIDANYQKERSLKSDLAILVKTCVGAGSNEVISNT